MVEIIETIEIPRGGRLRNLGRHFAADLSNCIVFAVFLACIPAVGLAAFAPAPLHALRIGSIVCAVVLVGFVVVALIAAYSSIDFDDQKGHFPRQMVFSEGSIRITTPSLNLIIPPSDVNWMFGHSSLDYFWSALPSKYGILLSIHGRYVACGWTDSTAQEIENYLRESGARDCNPNYGISMMGRPNWQRMAVPLSVGTCVTLLINATLYFLLGTWRYLFVTYLIVQPAIFALSECGSWPSPGQLRERVLQMIGLTIASSMGIFMINPAFADALVERLLLAVVAGAVGLTCGALMGEPRNIHQHEQTLTSEELA